MKLFDRYKYGCMPDLARSTPELRGAEQQIFREAKSRMLSIMVTAAQLAGVNLVALIIIVYGVAWINTPYLPMLHIVAPFVGLAYSVKLLKVLGFAAIALYPLGFAHEELKAEIARRRSMTMPDAMDDLR